MSHSTKDNMAESAMGVDPSELVLFSRRPGECGTGPNSQAGDVTATRRLDDITVRKSAAWQCPTILIDGLVTEVVPAVAEMVALSTMVATLTNDVFRWASRWV
jgi:hypothetical protein